MSEPPVLSTAPPLRFASWRSYLCLMHEWLCLMHGWEKSRMLQWTGNVPDCTGSPDPIAVPVIVPSALGNSEPDAVTAGCAYCPTPKEGDVMEAYNAACRVRIKGIPIVHALLQCCMAMLSFGYFAFCSSDTILHNGDLCLQNVIARSLVPTVWPLSWPAALAVGNSWWRRGGAPRLVALRASAMCLL